MELDAATDTVPIGQVMERSTIPQSQSPVSKAEAWEIEERKRKEEGRVRRRANVWKELIEARGPRYAKATLETFVCSTPEQTAAKAAVEAYAKDMTARLEAGQNVLFIGPAGTGKDHLMMPLCHAAIGAFKTLIWTNGASLWLAFREAISEGNKRAFCTARLFDDYEQFDAGLHGSESQIIDKLAEVDVLCISDPLPPGSSLTDYQTGNLLQIIDRRYSHLRPTWMTVNVANRKEAETRMGGPTVDRICHDALTVVCDWPSYRQKQKTTTEESK